MAAEFTRFSLILALVFSLLSCRSDNVDNIVGRLERNVSRSEKIIDARNYDRFYFITNGDIISAVYIRKGYITLPTSKRDCAEARASKEICDIYLGMGKGIREKGWTQVPGAEYFPFVNDGGCGVLKFDYSTKNERIKGGVECETSL